MLQYNCTAIAQYAIPQTTLLYAVHHTKFVKATPQHVRLPPLESSLVEGPQSSDVRLRGGER